MTEMFKEILQKDFYQEIFDALNEELTDNYDEYDLTIRANCVWQYKNLSFRNLIFPAP